VKFTVSFVAAGALLALTGSILIRTRETGGLLLTGAGVGWAVAIVAARFVAAAMYRPDEPETAPAKDPHFASGGFR
jgi:hypothetical protein